MLKKVKNGRKIGFVFGIVVIYLIVYSTVITLMDFCKVKNMDTVSDVSALHTMSNHMLGVHNTSLVNGTITYVYPDDQAYRNFREYISLCAEQLDQAELLAETAGLAKHQTHIKEPAEHIEAWNIFVNSMRQYNKDLNALTMEFLALVQTLSTVSLQTHQTQARRLENGLALAFLAESVLRKAKRLGREREISDNMENLHSQAALLVYGYDNNSINSPFKLADKSIAHSKANPPKTAPCSDWGEEAVNAFKPYLQAICDFSDGVDASDVRIVRTILLAEKVPAQNSALFDLLLYE